MYIFNAVHPDKGITDRYIATGHGLSQLFFHRRFCITSKGMQGMRFCWGVQAKRPWHVL